MPVKKSASAAAPRRTRKSPAGSPQIDPAATAFAPDSGAIARRAYEIYVEQGWQDGHDLDHWLRAEQEILGRA